LRIQHSAPVAAGWTASLAVPTIPGMPPKLTEYELETCARACRALAFTEAANAEKMDNPALQATVAKRAECAAALAERFEKARQEALTYQASYPMPRKR
jgi:hypothetical protein